MPSTVRASQVTLVDSAPTVVGGVWCKDGACRRDDRAMAFKDGNWTVLSGGGAGVAGGPRSGHALVTVDEDFFGSGACAA